MSLRDQILAAEDITTETINIPEWGVDVKVRSLDLGQRNDAIKAARGLEKDAPLDLGVYYGHIIVYTVLDPETEQPVFTLNDVPALQRKSPAAADRIAKQALQQSGLDLDPNKSAVDVAGEDSSATGSDDSSS